jgi:DMSO/TMAO reductase YedYZ molybdopterin-dependent catalytic subunit
LSASDTYTGLVAARVVDWGLAALVAALVATGVLTLFAGSWDDSWVYATHDAVSAAIVLLVVLKLRRVWPRVRSVARWDGRTTGGVLAAVFVLGAISSGLLWANGATPKVLGYSLLASHDALGAVLVIAVVAHMVARARRLRARHVADRRQFLAVLGIAAGAFVAWRAQRPVQTLFGMRAARRRFTGSYEADSFAGNAFPTTSWVADHPRPIDAATFRLRVHGLVDREVVLALADLRPAHQLTATLDCTGGFYSTQRWHGVRLGEILELAGVDPAARHVSVASRTGYRWSFAFEDARKLLLATHLGGEPLSHEHGAPLRLVVPGARGYQWVKWVSRIELRETPDFGSGASTVWSSFTRAGRGGV